MLLIRGFEQRVSQLFRDGEVPGFVHLSIGQEASAVGACWPLGPADVITSTHRGHGHCLAKGLDPLGMFAELMAQGRRHQPGSRRLDAHRRSRSSASSAPTASWPPDCPSRSARRRRRSCARTASVAVSFFGDGAVAHGAFHEAVNLAAVWQLPVIFFCENNGYAEFSPAATQHAAPLERRAAGYGIDYVAVDGNDVTATAAVMAERVAAVRAGGGPVLVEATTYRWHGHYEGDPERYRTPEEVQAWAARDPLVVHAERLRAAGAAEATIAALADGGRPRARRSRRCRAPARRPAASHRSPTSSSQPRPARPEPPAARRRTRPSSAPWTRSGPRWRPSSRPTSASSSPASTSPTAAAFSGSPAGCARQFGERVRDTPISETAIIGLGVGAAMAGMRPVVELMYLDFLGVCFDQLLNQAAKMSFMTGGAAQMGLTVRTQFGAGRSAGSQHSQSLEALLAHIPGLTVVMPSTPADTYGLLRAAIQDPNPVVFIENRLLYGMKGPQPPADYLLPIGKAAVVRPGDDITVVSVSRMVHEALAAAETVAAEGISVEVIDLRTVAPLDMATVLDSVRRTNRLLIAHEAVVDVRHRRRDRRDRRPGCAVRPRRTDRAPRRRLHSPAVRAGPGARLAARPRRHRRRPSPARRVLAQRQQPSVRAITMCWISLVPSPISRTLASQ